MTGATAFSEVSLRTLQLHALAAVPQVSPSSGKEGQVLRLLGCTVGRSGEPKIPITFHFSSQVLD